MIFASKRNLIITLAALVGVAVLAIVLFSLLSPKGKKNDQLGINPPPLHDVKKYNAMISTFILLSEHKEAFKDIKQPLNMDIFSSFEHLQSGNLEKCCQVFDKILGYLKIEVESLEDIPTMFIDYLFKKIVADITKEQDPKERISFNSFVSHFCFTIKKTDSTFEYISIATLASKCGFVGQMTSDRNSFDNIFDIGVDPVIESVPKFYVFRFLNTHLYEEAEKKTLEYFYKGISGKIKRKYRSKHYEMFINGFYCSEHAKYKQTSFIISYLKEGAIKTFNNDRPLKDCNNMEVLFPTCFIVEIRPVG